MEEENSFYVSFLERQYGDLIDKKLLELNLLGIQERLTKRIVTQVESQVAQHDALKATLQDIEDRTNLLFQSQSFEESLPPVSSQVHTNRLASSKGTSVKNVIVIDDDDDEDDDNENFIPESITFTLLENINVKFDSINQDKTAEPLRTSKENTDADNEEILPQKTDKVASNDTSNAQNSSDESAISAISQNTNDSLQDNTTHTKEVENSANNDNNLNISSTADKLNNDTMAVCNNENVNSDNDEVIFVKNNSAETFLGVDSDLNQLTPNKNSPSKDISLGKLSPPSAALFDVGITPEKSSDSQEAVSKISLLKTLEKVTDKFPEIEPLDCDDNIFSNNLKRPFINTDSDSSIAAKSSKLSPNEKQNDGNSTTIKTSSKNISPLSGERLKSGLKVLLPKRSHQNSSPLTSSSESTHKKFRQPAFGNLDISDTDRSDSVSSESSMVSPASSIKDSSGKFFRVIYVGDKVYAKPNRSDIWFQAEIKKLPKSKGRKNKKYVVQFAAGERVQLRVSDRQIATFDAVQPDQMVIGSRVVAGRPSDTVNVTISKKFNDQGGLAINVMFAGTIAEVACEANRFRYLVFFDDGYAQYIPADRMFPIYASSVNVWDDVGDDCREFVKEYLQEYPYRPMVVTNIGSSMLAEWNGEWWKSKVVSIDSSLIKLLFDIDQRSEWLYRGTLRLEPLFNFFNNQKTDNKKKKKKKTESYVDEKIAHPQFGISKFSKTDPKGEQQRKEWKVESPRPFSRQSSTSSSKSSIILKISRKRNRVESESDTTTSFGSGKGISPNNNTIKNAQSSECQSPEQISSQEALGIMAALELGSNTNSPVKTPKTTSPSKQLQRSLSTCSSESSHKSRSKTSLKKKSNGISKANADMKYIPHVCSPDCIKDKQSPMDNYHTGNINYLAVPLMVGWKRESVKRNTGYHRDIFYRSPCNKRLRNIESVADYLILTKCSNVFIDMFCFQSSISCQNDVIRSKPVLLRIPDLSKGEEKLPIECVNELNTESPSAVTYISHRITASDVKINKDKNFMACCDCTDFCQDKSKCACSKLTYEGRHKLESNSRKRTPGYSCRKLRDFIPTGVYECNDNCKCSKTGCFNRVVQNGIKLRLQVFRTENRGWGLRCVDDIAKGTFICTYAGHILNEQTANREGKDFGDEYLAELDYIEVAEKSKEGYESDVPELRPGYDDSSTSSCDEIDNIESDDSSDDSSIIIISDGMDDTDTSGEKSNGANTTTENKSDELMKKRMEKLKELKVTLRRIPSEEIPKKKEGSASDESWSISDKDEKGGDDTDDNSRSFCDVISSVQKESLEKKPDEKDVETGDQANSSKDANLIKRKLARKTTGQKLHFPPHLTGSAIVKDKNEDGCSATRRFFDSKGELYIIDAKYIGNVGRYMNHSCSPNLFVQNVLVDTHDLRFPWVAFFAQKNIPAFTELTWDYNYEVGSVPNKELYCRCGSKDCQGRIL